MKVTGEVSSLLKYHSTIFARVWTKQRCMTEKRKTYNTIGRYIKCLFQTKEIEIPSTIILVMLLQRGTLWQTIARYFDALYNMIPHMVPLYDFYVI